MKTIQNGTYSESMYTKNLFCEETKSSKNFGIVNLIVPQNLIFSKWKKNILDIIEINFVVCTLT